MISARRRKNTVSESRMEMERLTWTQSVIVNITLAPAFQISVAMFSLHNDSIIKVRLEYRIE